MGSRSIHTVAVVLGILALVASPASGQQGQQGQQAECFKAAYSQPVGEAFAELFPAWVALLPGTTSGTVEIQPAPGDTTGFSLMFRTRASWTRPTADSLRLMLSNGFTGMSFKLVRSENGYEGKVAIHYDFPVDTVPSMHVRLTPDKCPAQRRRSRRSAHSAVRHQPTAKSAPPRRTGTAARP